jgi:outer membrane lipoprotein SlyB
MDTSSDKPLSARSAEREGPIAERWEGEAFLRGANVSASATHLTFPRLRRGPLPLPPEGRRRAWRALLLIFALTACAPVSDYRPAVDLAGIDPARFEADLHDCQKVAARDRYGPVLARVVQGATIGAALGAVAGGYAGNIGLATSYGAISGTVAGGAVGAAESQGATPFPDTSDEKAVVEECLRNNGYSLLAPAGHINRRLIKDKPDVPDVAIRSQ